MGTMHEEDRPRQPLLDRPLGRGQAVLWWTLASALFILVVVGQFGPTNHDAIEWDTPAWTLAHGQPSCSYRFGFQTEPPPLFPELVGGVEVTVHSLDRRLFAARPYPTVDCRQDEADLSTAASLHDAALIGFLAWFVLLCGVVLVFRSDRRPPTIREAAGVLGLAVLPPVSAALTTSIHPEDLVAVGLCLAAVARSTRRRDVLVGVLFGLAACSQQFALLAVVPIVVLAGWGERARVMAGAGAAASAVCLPFLITDPGGLLHAFSGSSATQAGGATPTFVLEIHLHGVLLVVVSRGLPLLAAAIFTWGAGRRLGDRRWAVVPLLSVLAVCMTFRLLFEVELFLWYFAAVAVLLLLVAAMDRSATPLWLVSWAAWNAVVVICYSERSWDSFLQMSLVGLVSQAIVVGWAFGLGVTVLWRTSNGRVGQTDEGKMAGVLLGLG